VTPSVVTRSQRFVPGLRNATRFLPASKATNRAVSQPAQEPFLIANDLASSRASQAFVSFWYSPKDFPTNPATGRRPRLGFAGTFAAFTAAFTAADLVRAPSLFAAASRYRAASSRCRRLASRSRASDAGPTSAGGTAMRICWPGLMFRGTRTLIVRPSGARTWRMALGAVPAGIWTIIVVLIFFVVWCCPCPGLCCEWVCWPATLPGLRVRTVTVPALLRLPGAKAERRAGRCCPGRGAEQPRAPLEPWPAAHGWVPEGWDGLLGSGPRTTCSAPNRFA